MNMIRFIKFTRQQVAVLALLAVTLAAQINQSEAQWPFSSSSSSSSTTTSSSSSSSTGPDSSSSTTTTTTITTSISSPSLSTSLIKPRANRLRRPESCRENLPRKSEELPSLVITGRVREVYLAGSSGQPAQQVGSVLDTNTNRALVTVGRVIKGNPQLLNTDIIVSGFNSTNSSPCPNYVKPNDTLILLLELEYERRYAIQGGHLLPMNLANLDRINAIASDEPLKRRGPIEDILCEAKYCPYGRCVVTNESSGEVACKCPDSCTPIQQPVCGSDNVTYSSECHLIREGCARKRPLFVTKESSC